MTWWRAPLIAAAISTLLCGLSDACYRRQVDEMTDKFEELQNEWQRDPQLAAQLDRERDIAGMLEVRRDATAFVHSKQPSTFTTLSAVLPPPALHQLTIRVALKRFRITGPITMRAKADQWISHVNGVNITKRAVNGPEFMIEGWMP